MSKMEELLRRKYALLCSAFKIKHGLLMNAEYKAKHGHYPPREEGGSWVGFHVEQMIEDKLEKIRIIDLEIENMELKAKLEECSA